MFWFEFKHVNAESSERPHHLGVCRRKDSIYSMGMVCSILKGTQRDTLTARNIMDKKRTRSSADLFDEGLKCFHKPDGIGAVRAFEAVVKNDLAYRHEDGDNPYFYLAKLPKSKDGSTTQLCFIPAR